MKPTLAAHGLNLNSDKCKVQTTNPNWQRHRTDFDDVNIPLVDPRVGFKILGAQFTLKGRTSAELLARIAAGWAKFPQMKPMLCRIDGLPDERLRIFDACMGQSVLWCAESWVPTKKVKRMLTTTQNCMLRRVTGPRRAPGEMIITWLKRATKVARERSNKSNARFCAESHLKAKWAWARHVQHMKLGEIQNGGKLNWR